MAENTQLLYSWSYEDTKDRSPLWYTIALSIAIGLIIWGFLTKQYGMSIVIMLVVGFFFFLENNSEDTVKVDITELGIKIQNAFYDYSRIASFCILYHGEQAVYLQLHLKKKGLSFANLRIDNSITNDIRSILLEYVEEKPKGEVSFLEKVAHFLKL